MLRGVERAPLESRKAIRRATATDEVCTLPAALVGAVATFVLAVTQPASDDANATSANPVEIRRVAATRSFDIRSPPGRISANLPNPQSRVRTKSIMATREQIWRGATPTPNNAPAEAEHGPGDAAIAIALLSRDETSGFDPALIPARTPRSHCGASGSVTR